MGYDGSDRGFRDPRYRREERGYGGDDWRGGRGGFDRNRGEMSRYGGGGHRYERSRYDAPPPDYNYDDRGFFDRAGDEVRSWFGDEEAERRRRYDERYAMREEERGYGRDTPARDRSDYGVRDRSDYGARHREDRSGYRAGGYGASAGAGAAWAGGTGSRHDHDPNYRAWRDRQIEALDRDYDDYRREHQSRFDQHFGEWRQGREQQRQSLRQVQKHQEVVGSDGQHVGTVDAVKGDRLVLTRKDSEAGGRHHEIPCTWIARVADKVELNRTHDQAQAAWRDVEHDHDRGGLFGGEDRDRGDGPHILDRSFSGTY